MKRKKDMTQDELFAYEIEQIRKRNKKARKIVEDLVYKKYNPSRRDN